MRSSLLLGAVAAFGLAVWLAFTLSSPGGSGAFTLEVPATHLSVGQQIRPRLVSASRIADETVQIDLQDASGHSIWSQRTVLGAGLNPAVLASPIMLPHPGAYRLSARAGARVQSIALQAVPPTPVDYGGVVSLAALGLAPGAADYLRQHSFAVAKAGVGDLPPARLYLVGDPRLGLAPADAAAAYTALWRQVAGGAQVLLLQPPPPGVAADWPLQAPLVRASGACGADLDAAPLLRGLNPDAALKALLRPRQTFDVSALSTLDLYHWDGGRLARSPRQSGYAGCHPLLTYRYGSGWVTESNLPLLQHFQDVRARIFLMNLIDAVLRRKPWVPASPGLQWVMERRLKRLRQSPGNPLQTEAALYFQPPPAPVAPVPLLVPLPDPAAAQPAPDRSCWTSPSTAAGATLTLDFDRPLPVHRLLLTLRLPVAAGVTMDAPASFQLDATADDIHWTALPLPPGQASPAPSPPPSGHRGALEALDLPVPSPPAAWRAFRLTFTHGAPSQVCRFAAQ